MCVFVRLAYVGEEDVIEKIYLEARNEFSTWTDEYPGREEIDFDIAHGFLWVLDDGGEIAACVSMIDYDDVNDMDADWSDGPFRVMARLCAARAFQGRGCARRLLEEVYAAEAKNGTKFVRFLCAQKNVYAMRVYDKMGVRKLGEVHIYGGDYTICEQRTEAGE